MISVWEIQLDLSLNFVFRSLHFFYIVHLLVIVCNIEYYLLGTGKNVLLMFPSRNITESNPSIMNGLVFFLKKIT